MRICHQWAYVYCLSLVRFCFKHTAVVLSYLGKPNYILVMFSLSAKMGLIILIRITQVSRPN